MQLTRFAKFEFSLGTVKIWDIRQKNQPVIKIDSMEEAKGSRDTWCVAFGMFFLHFFYYYYLFLYN